MPNESQQLFLKSNISLFGKDPEVLDTACANDIIFIDVDPDSNQTIDCKGKDPCIMRIGVKKNDPCQVCICVVTHERGSSNSLDVNFYEHGKDPYYTHPLYRFSGSFENYSSEDRVISDCYRVDPGVYDIYVVVNGVNSTKVEKFTVPGCSNPPGPPVSLDKCEIKAVAKVEQNPCTGLADVTINVVGLYAGGLEYTWSDNNRAEKSGSPYVRYQVKPGNYTVKVFGRNVAGVPCKATVDVYIPNKKSDLELQLSPSVSCNRCSLQVLISGGSAPYTITWRKNDQQVATGVSLLTDVDCNAKYTVEVIDSSGCIKTESLTIFPNQPSVDGQTQATPRRFTLSSVSVVSKGQTSVSPCKWRYEVDAVGGAPGYHYEWFREGTDVDSQKPDIPIRDDRSIELEPGTWFVRVTDQNGCFGWATVVVPKCGTKRKDHNEVLGQERRISVLEPRRDFGSQASDRFTGESLAPEMSAQPHFVLRTLFL